MTESKSPQSKRTLASFIFLSRWLQAPLYLGLIVAQAVYVCRFLLELWHLIGFALLGHPAPASVPTPSVAALVSTSSVPASLSASMPASMSASVPEHATDAETA